MVFLQDKKYFFSNDVLFFGNFTVLGCKFDVDLRFMGCSFIPNLHQTYTGKCKFTPNLHRQV